MALRTAGKIPAGRRVTRTGRGWRVHRTQPPPPAHACAAYHVERETFREPPLLRRAITVQDLIGGKAANQAGRNYAADLAGAGAAVEPAAAEVAADRSAA